MAGRILLIFILNPFPEKMGVHKHWEKKENLEIQKSWEYQKNGNTKKEQTREALVPERYADNLLECVPDYCKATSSSFIIIIKNVFLIIAAQHHCHIKCPLIIAKEHCHLEQCGPTCYTNTLGCRECVS